MPGAGEPVLEPRFLGVKLKTSSSSSSSSASFLGGGGGIGEKGKAEELDAADESFEDGLA